MPFDASDGSPGLLCRDFALRELAAQLAQPTLQAALVRGQQAPDNPAGLGEVEVPAKVVDPLRQGRDLGLLVELEPSSSRASPRIPSKHSARYPLLGCRSTMFSM